VKEKVGKKRKDEMIGARMISLKTRKAGCADNTFLFDQIHKMENILAAGKVAKSLNAHQSALNMISAPKLKNE